MRVMIVDPLFSTRPYDQALCTALVAQGHDVTILARPCGLGETWPTEAGHHAILTATDVFAPSRHTGWRLKVHTLVRHLRYALQIQSIGRRVTERQIDVVHFQWCLTPLAEALLIRRLRGRTVTVLTVHDTQPFNGSKVSSFLTLGSKRLMQGVDRLIVHTRSAAETLKGRGLPGDRIAVIPHGLLQVVQQRVGPALPPRLHAKVQVLLFGHVKHYKGTDILIRAAALLSDQAKAHVCITVAGQLGVPFADLERLCADSGVSDLFAFDLRFLSDEEADAAMRQADIFVFPYREIQASGVFTLALNYGRPIVASNLGIFADNIRDGVNGFLVPPQDPVALGAALDRLCSDAHLRDVMGRRNLELLQTYPSWNEIARLTTQAYVNANLTPVHRLG